MRCSSTPRLNSTCGGACATARPRRRRNPRPSRPTMRTRGSRSRRTWPRRGSSPSRPVCNARSRRTVLRSSESLLHIAQERLRVGNGNEQAVAEARVNVGTYRDNLRQTELAREQAMRALELLLGRYPAAEICRRLAPAAHAPADACRHAVPIARAPARRDRGGTSRRRGIQPDRRSEGRPAAAHQPDRRRQHHNERCVRVAGTEQPGVQLRREPSCPDLSGWRIAGAGRNSHSRAETGDRGICAYGAEGVLRGRERARGGEYAARSRAILDATLRDSARALELAQIQYRVGSVDLRAVEQNQLALFRHGCRSCAFRPNGARSESTCISRWAAAPTCRPWNPWR